MTRQQARGLVLAAALALALPAAAQGIPASAGGRIAGLLGDAGGDRVLPGGYVFSDVAIDRDQVTCTLTRKAGGRVVGRLRLVPRGEARPGERQSVHFALRLEVLDPDPQVRAALEAGAANVRQRDRADLWSDVVEPVSQPRLASAPPSPAARRAAWLAQVSLALALLGALGIYAVRRPRRGGDAGPPPSP